jgi:flagellar hook protein FlgE
MSSAIANALSGLTANATAINIVSNNLANLSTSGFKDEQISFEDLVNQSASGALSSTSVSGSTNAFGIQQFTQGTVATTGNPYDAAIQGGGFFVLQDSLGQQLLTRQGNFTVDSNGNLVTQVGQFVQGWNSVAGQLTTTGPTSNITLPAGLALAPTATTTFSLNLNLNTNAVVGSSSGTFSSPVQVVDAQGTTHTLTVTYTETAPNAWNYAVTIPSADLAGGVGANTTLASGALTFDGTGHLLTPAAGAGTVPVAITGLADGASDMNLTWNLYDSTGTTALITQDTSTSANLSSSQNGVQGGQLTGLAISNNGVVVGTFSNGATLDVAQLALASVANPSTMSQSDGNSWVPTAGTSRPVIGLPGTGARGGITGQALEGSTVNIATEFTNLLQFERGYQANSKVITTEDEIVQQTISLIANP